ncbi:hypothetical protein LC092_00395 [Stappia stellulata]|uniref:hypothetical protein n=1 Tax=Stappia stellulata TaxID=71235 RepID=UPI001CD24E33|nr:hypothetical protein [Stappia stellulata]MCA1240887.1 hypothetical protein [Stappia stellulata]
MRLCLVICVAGLLGGCAYAPSGTLFEALDGGDPYVSPGTASAVMPGAGQLAQSAAAVEAGTGTSSGTPVEQGFQSSTTPAGNASTGALSGAPSVSRGLMSYEEAEEQRLRLQELARNREAIATPRATTSLDKLKRLWAEHADRAVQDIEGPAGE